MPAPGLAVPGVTQASPAVASAYSIYVDVARQPAYAKLSAAEFWGEAVLKHEELSRLVPLRDTALQAAARAPSAVATERAFSSLRRVDVPQRRRAKPKTVAANLLIAANSRFVRHTFGTRRPKHVEKKNCRCGKRKASDVVAAAAAAGTHEPDDGAGSDPDWQSDIDCYDDVSDSEDEEDEEDEGAAAA